MMRDALRRAEAALGFIPLGLVPLRPAPRHPRVAGRAPVLATALAALALAGCAQPRDPAAGDRVAADPSGQCAEIADLVAQAQRDNFTTEFAAAETIWARLATIYASSPTPPRERCGDIVPAWSEVMANQALVYSNQRKFIAADGMFRAASRQAQAESGGVTDIVQVLETQHDLNRAVDAGADALQQAEDLAADIGADVEAAPFSADLDQILQLSPEAQRRRVLASLKEFSRSFVYLQAEDYPKAEAAIDKAIDLIRPAPGARANYLPRYRTTKALLQLGQGKYEEARLSANAAYLGYSEDLRATALGARALTFQARAETLLGRREEALATYARAFDTYQDTAVPIGYDLVWPYFNLALTTMQADPSREAELTRAIFIAAQTLRSRTTAASLAVAARDRAEGDGAEAQAIRAFLAARLEFQRIEADRNTVLGNSFATDEQRDEVNRSFRDAGEMLEARTAALSEIADDYLGLLSARTDVDRILASLHDDEAMIQIIPGDPYSIAFVLTKDGIRAGRVGGSVNLASIREFVSFLRAGLRAGRPFRPNDSFALYQEMVEPALALLGGKRPRHLIFSLSDALTSLPVEVLAVRRSAIPDNRRGTDFTDVEWMADRYEISYVPAPSTLPDLRGSVAAAPEDKVKKVVAFGDFTAGVKAEDVLPVYLPDECLVFAQAVAGLGPLPASRLEMEIIKEIFGDRAQIHTGAEFTEAAVEADSAQGKLAEADVIHFATHGFLPQSSDCLSQGGLTVSVDGAPGEDGVLFESEIRRLDLSGAELVVLTACDTAGAANLPGATDGNTAEGGEALSGLARAFFDAGARAALVTHWPIPDNASSIFLVQEFYRALDAGASYTEALRTAQTAVRKDPRFSNPFFWGAFVLVGDGAGGGRGTGGA